MILNELLFASPSSGATEEPNFLVTFAPIILMFVVLYFFMIRPQRKRQKEREQLLEAIQKGDKVVTIGGAHGKIAGVDNEKKIVWVQLSENVKIQYDKTAIASIEKTGGTKSEPSKTADKLSTKN